MVKHPRNVQWKWMQLLLLLTLPACLAQSNIQSSYMEQHKSCQEAARVPSADGEDAAAPVSVTQFARCMNATGWHVATPKTAPAQPAAQSAAQPAAQASATAGQPAAAQPQPVPPQQAAVPPAAAQAAPQTAPQTAVPSGVPTAPVQQPVAAAQPVYPPARPAGAPEVYYGSGAGRQF